MFDIIKNKKLIIFIDYAILVNLCIYIFSMIISESFLYDIGIIYIFFSKVIKVTFLFAFIKLLLDFFSNKFDLKEIIIYIIIGLFLIYIYWKNFDAMPLLILVYSIGLKKCDKNKFFKYSFYTMLFAFVLVVLLSIILNNHKYDYLYDYGNVQKLRYSLGFKWVSYAQNYFLFIFLTFILYKKNISIYLISIFAIIGIILFIFTNTKNSFFYLILTTVIYIIFINIKNKKICDLIFYISKISFPLCAIFIYFLCYFYVSSNKFFSSLNHYLSGRLEWGHSAIQKYGITLLGNNINIFNTVEYSYVDSSYLHILFVDGILVLILVLFAYVYMCFVLAKKKNYLFTIVLLIISFYAIFDPHLILIYYSPFILLSINIMYDKNN